MGYPAARGLFLAGARAHVPAPGSLGVPRRVDGGRGLRAQRGAAAGADGAPVHLLVLRRLAHLGAAAAPPRLAARGHCPVRLGGGVRRVAGMDRPRGHRGLLARAPRRLHAGPKGRGHRRAGPDHRARCRLPEPHRARSPGAARSPPAPRRDPPPVHGAPPQRGARPRRLLWIARAAQPARRLPAQGPADGVPRHHPGPRRGLGDRRQEPAGAPARAPPRRAGLGVRLHQLSPQPASHLPRSDPRREAGHRLGEGEHRRARRRSRVRRHHGRLGGRAPRGAGGAHARRRRAPAGLPRGRHRRAGVRAVLRRVRLHQPHRERAAPSWSGSWSGWSSSGPSPRRARRTTAPRR